MTDIVERLRAPGTTALDDEAAAEIERLRRIINAREYYIVWNPIETMPEARQVLVSDGVLVRPGTREGADVVHAPFPMQIKLWLYWAAMPKGPEVLNHGR